MITSVRLDTRLDTIYNRSTSNLYTLEGTSDIYLDWYISEVNGISLPKPRDIRVSCKFYDGTIKDQSSNLIEIDTGYNRGIHIKIYNTVFTGSGEFTVKVYTVDDILIVTKSFSLTNGRIELIGGIDEDHQSVEERVVMIESIIGKVKSDVYNKLAMLHSTIYPL